MAAALFGLLLVANAGHDLVGGGGVLGVEWLVPVVTGGMVGTLAWLLLAGEQQEEDQSVAHSRPCPACGSAVGTEWRLCPYCGHYIGSDEATETSANAV